MTPLLSVWVASLAGAMFFFAAGFFLARRAHGEAAAVDEMVPPRVPPPVVEPPSSTAAAEPVNPDRAALRAQVGDLERDVLQLRDENAGLRREASAAAVTRARVVELERELGAGRSVVAPLPRLSSGTVPPRVPGELRSTAEQLSTLLHRLDAKNMRGIALSDEVGLPIVGLGDETSPLAAFSGYLADLARKARDFLPLGPLRRVIIEDESDTTITTCPQFGEASIALVTMTVGPGPSARQMGDVLRSAADMLR